jgi:hypothetical protein
MTKFFAATGSGGQILAAAANGGKCFAAATNGWNVLAATTHGGKFFAAAPSGEGHGREVGVFRNIFLDVFRFAKSR